MMAIVQLVSFCAEKLHIANLVDAYAELIKARAFCEEVHAFDFHFFIGALAMFGLLTIYLNTRV